MSQPKLNFCGNCGNKLNEDAKFCPKCGKKLFSVNQNSAAREPPSMNQNIPVQPPQYKTQYPPQRYAPPVKAKSKAGLKITLLSVIIIIVIAGLFFAYKIFFSGPHKLKAEYKVPDVKSLVKLDSSGMAPANMFGVMLKDGFGKGDADVIAKMINGKVVGEIELNNVFQIEFDGKTKEDLYSALKKVKSSDKVDAAFPDGFLRMDGAENSFCNPLDDPFYDGKDGNPYKMINLKQAWDIIKASGVKLNDVIVGVVDVGVNYKSDKLNTGKPIILPLVPNDINTKDELTHGTMVTDMIAANGENGGMTGVASNLGEHLQVNTSAGSDLSFIPLDKNEGNSKNVSEFEYKGNICTMEAMKNIQKQIDNGATILNCSFSNHLKDYTNDQSEEYSKVFKKFLERTQKKYPDVIIIGTAGNDENKIRGNKIWAHKMDNLVTVGALNREGKMADYSNVAVKNTDDEVTVVACGDDKMEDGKSYSGTSFSAPTVTGIIAMMRSINPKLTPAEIKKILTETSKQVVEKNIIDEEYNQQLVQADDAVLKAIELTTGKKWDKKKLLENAKVDLKSEGTSPEFKITATVESVSEKGTVLEIECSGGEYALGGNSKKTLTSAGSVTWSLTIPKPDTKLSVRVTRLDTKACKTILVGGDDIIGTYKGKLMLVKGYDKYGKKTVSNNEIIIKITAPNILKINFHADITDEDNVVEHFKGNYEGVIDKNLTYDIPGILEVSSTEGAYLDLILSEPGTFHHRTEEKENGLIVYSKKGKSKMFGSIVNNIISGTYENEFYDFSAAFIFEVPLNKSK